MARSDRGGGTAIGLKPAKDFARAREGKLERKGAGEEKQERRRRRGQTLRRRESRAS